MEDLRSLWELEAELQPNDGVRPPVWRPEPADLTRDPGTRGWATQTRKGGPRMSVVKVLELVGESHQSWQDAANQAVMEASRTVDNITAVEVSNWTASVEEGRINRYKANVRVAFVVDRDRPAKV